MPLSKVFHPNALRERFFSHEASPRTFRGPGDSLPPQLFCLTVVLYACYLAAMQSDWVLAGEMWAEMATNYFPAANAQSIGERLFSTDAGYIPLPQRLLAYLGSLLRLPASAVPYFYTWSGIAATAMMVGAFCLRPFRAVVNSDSLRFVTAISVLLLADFETRTFINFTYYVPFLAAIVTALALADDSVDVPAWAWILPILMLSKPAALTVLPAMILVAFVSRRRFRLITLVATLVCLAQVVQLVLSHKGGAFVPTAEISRLDKLHASIRYFFGYVGYYTTGTALDTNIFGRILSGLAIAAFCLVSLLASGRRSHALLVVGLSLLFWNLLLNCFALSDTWNLDMARLQGAPIYRHIIVGFFGVVLMVASLAALLSERRRESSGALRASLGAVLMLAWLAGSGWLAFAGALNRVPGLPTTQNSQWQQMAQAIDAGVPVCVPVDPLGWMYGIQCKQLNPEITRENSYRFAALPTGGAGSYFLAPPPDGLDGKSLISLAAMVRPTSNRTGPINAMAIVRTKDGTSRYFTGARELPATGGLILLTSDLPVATEDIASIRLSFGSPVALAFEASKSANTPAILWMGR